MNRVEKALAIVRKLTRAEFHSFMAQLSADETSASDLPFNALTGKKRFNHGIVCPHCGSSATVRNGTRNGLQNCRCKECGRYFSNITKTVVSHSKYGHDKWKQYIGCMMKGMSIRQSASECGISNATSFYWRHKILEALQGITEIQ